MLSFDASRCRLVSGSQKLMPIYTPRGLKIRLPVNFAFALMARLHPHVPPFRVLKTTEGIEGIPATTSFLVAIVCFALSADPVVTGVAVFVTSATAASLNRYGLFVVPGLVGLGTAFSWVSGYGVLLIGLLAFGYYRCGWQGVAAYFVGRGVAGALGGILEWHESRKAFELIGFPVSASERNFINAYRLHAGDLGLSTDITVPDEELSEENWMHVFVEFAGEWPDVAARFTR